MYLYIYTYTLYMYTCIHTYIHTYVSLPTVHPSLPPSLSLVAYILLRYPYPTRYPHWPIPSKFKQKVLKVSSRQPGSQAELQFNRSTAPPSRPQDLLKRERERVQETCLINAQTFLLEIKKYCTYCTYTCVHSVHSVQYCAIKARQERTGPERNGSDQQSFYRFRFFFFFVSLPCEGSRLRIFRFWVRCYGLF